MQQQPLPSIVMPIKENQKEKKDEREKVYDRLVVVLSSPPSISRQIFKIHDNDEEEKPYISSALFLIESMTMMKRKNIIIFQSRTDGRTALILFYTFIKRPLRTFRRTSEMIGIIKLFLLISAGCKERRDEFNVSIEQNESNKCDTHGRPFNPTNQSGFFSL